MGIFLITDVPDNVFFLFLADMNKTENPAVKAARKKLQMQLHFDQNPHESNKKLNIPYAVSIRILTLP